ncbi:hypothetical protein H0E87_021941 [Populus deltoides]|uniref:Uncharacterized protein n=1 Tax=Populus deltoides TaxID=3696 RepID=A0A8T2XHA6_POPDE|nr:hypothetical protein H0E87_021941 [Populus deltoides]
MDLATEELQFLTIPEILKESISIPKQSPKTFQLITVALIFPLSFAILAHSLFTHPLLDQIQDHPSSQNTHQWTLLLVFQFFYLIFLFAFSLLSTAAVVFTVASLYTSKPVSFSSTTSAIPQVFKRLFITFLWVCLLMLVYNSVFLLFLVILIVGIDIQNTLLVLFSLMVIASLWSCCYEKELRVVEREDSVAGVLVFGYLSICGSVSVVFATVVVHGGDKYGVFTRIVVGGFLVGALVIVNLVGLLVQSVFYYVCKSYHHQGIDKTALHEHLGGYLGEYVPLKSSIQMENLDA